MGRIFFVSFFDLSRSDFFFFLPLSLGNHGPLVRRKDWRKFRSSLPEKPAVCKALLIFLCCTGLPMHWPVVAEDHLSSQGLTV